MQRGTPSSLTSRTGQFELFDDIQVSGIFGDPETVWQSEFAAALTAGEACKLAAHPDVQAIRMSASSMSGSSSPVAHELHPGPCPEANDAIEGKLVEEEFSQGREAQVVLVSVTGGADYRVLDVECPGGTRDCPERAAALDEVNAANLESQRYVRDHIAAIGGEVSDEVLGSVLIATLNWAQVVSTAAHPHVWNISPETFTEPP